MKRLQKAAKIFKEKTTWRDKEFFCEYIDCLDFSNIAPITQVQALCLLPTGEFVVYEDVNGQCGLPGGTVERDESLEDALFRELREEVAVRPIKYGPLLYLKITNLSEQPQRITYQVRYWALVELLDGEVSDPDGKAVRRRIVNEKKLTECVKWGRKLKVYLKQLRKLQKQGTAHG